MPLPRVVCTKKDVIGIIIFEYHIRVPTDEDFEMLKHTPQHNEDWAYDTILSLQDIGYSRFEVYERRSLYLSVP